MTESIPMLGADFPWLTLILLLLPLGAVVTACLPSREARWAALATAGLVLLIEMVIVGGFANQQSGFQFVERASWIPSLHVEYLVGLDGLSVLFLPFSGLLFIGVIAASWNAIRHHAPLFFALVLVLETAIVGIFSSLDTILFVLFWELGVIPLFFLISLWGSGANRRYAGMKYTLFMMSGGVCLLLGFVILGLQHPDGVTFDYTRLLHISHTHTHQSLVFFLLLAGFAAKLPLFPLHSWLSVVAQEGPAAIVGVLVGLKIGVYGLIRFTLPLAPDAAQAYQWLLTGLGMLGLLYGALAALGQTNLRRMLAFSSLSHVGMVVLGVASFNQQGLQGAVFQLLNFTVVASGLFIMLGFLHQRVGSCDLLSLGGISQPMPLLAAFFFFLGAASMGIPFTSGFPAEFLLIVGVLGENPGAGLLALFSIVLAAGYFLSAYRKAFFGQAVRAVVAEAPDLKQRELLVVLMFSGVVLLFGIYPQGILDVIENSSLDWLGRMTLMME